jgi:hypothetical protein
MGLFRRNKIFLASSDGARSATAFLMPESPMISRAPEFCGQEIRRG